MNIQVTSISKKEQKLSKVGAAIFVITQENIRRPGATNIPDLLRLAPGADYKIAPVPMGSNFSIVRAIGNPTIKAEEFRDLEAGYRAQANERLALDVTAFAGLYRNLELSAAQAPYFASHQGVPYLVLPELLVNGPRARTYGGEFFAHWNLPDRWCISAGYFYFHIHIDGDSQTLGTPAGISANHQFQVRSLLDLPRHLECDNTHRYVGNLVVGNIPAYARVDSRLGSRAGEFVELSWWDRISLLLGTSSFPMGIIRRITRSWSVFVTVTWRFDLRK